MDESNGFYTMKGYEINAHSVPTSSMEDYIEMIYRLTLTGGRVRINDIAATLHVKPSSASKMIRQLNLLGYTESEKYTAVTLTEKGLNYGKYLLYRHNVVLDFLCELNGSDDQLEQAEKIEHYLDKTTVKNLALLKGRLNPESAQK